MIAAVVVVVVAGVNFYLGYKVGVNETLAATEWANKNVPTAMFTLKAQDLETPLMTKGEHRLGD